MKWLSCLYSRNINGRRETVSSSLFTSSIVNQGLSCQYLVGGIDADNQNIELIIMFIYAQNIRTDEKLLFSIIPG